MIKVGLTGGIGTGKSIVSKMFKEEGIDVIDADLISREVLNIYSEINEMIKKEFGKEFFDSLGQLDRRKLGDYIFSHEDKRKQLEKIILPYIKKEIWNQFNIYEKKDKKICILDAPTLIEQGMDKKMDKNILVYVDEEIQIKRVEKRDKMSKDNVIKRINSQISLKEKKKCVNFIIDNSKDLFYTRKQVKKIINSLISQG